MEDFAVIFGKKYTLNDLRDLERGKKDKLIEFVSDGLDYICDCSKVEFFKDYCMTFKNRSTGQEVYVYVRCYESGEKKVVETFYPKSE